MSLSRNDPCHCGSGKKYKKCHLNSDASREREQRNLRTLAEWVAFYRAGLETSVSQAAASVDDVVARQIALFDGETPPIAEATIEDDKRAARLTTLRAALAESHLSLHEVIECKPGKGLRFHDCLLGEDRWVGNPELATVLEPMEVVLGRVMAFEKKFVLLEGYERVYFRGRKAAIADLFAQIDAAAPAPEGEAPDDEASDEEQAAHAETQTAWRAAKLAWLGANANAIAERARAATP